MGCKVRKQIIKTASPLPPKEPNGQNEVSSVGESERVDHWAWRILFLLVTNAPFKDLVSLFQTSLTPISTGCHCPAWRRGGHVGKSAAGEPMAAALHAP